MYVISLPRRSRQGKIRGVNLAQQFTVYKQHQRRFFEILYGTQDFTEPIQRGLFLLSKSIDRQARDVCTKIPRLLEFLHGSQAHPEDSTLENCFCTANDCATFLRNLTSKTSTRDIASMLFAHYDVQPAVQPEHENEAHQLIIAVLGWMTMLFSVAGSSASNGDRLSQSVRHMASRPLVTMLRTINVIPVACKGTPRDHISLLTASNLHFSTLEKVGGVCIIWTDELSRHCQFDSNVKQLYLFRHPSFCVQARRYAETSVIDRVLRSHSCEHGCENLSSEFFQDFLLEVLLSYRLLFGQDSDSRRLYRTKEEIKAGANGTCDPLLRQLCGRSRVSTKTRLQGELNERGVYELKDNFPQLGKKLLALQDYSISQAPKKFKEIWNDRRQPYQLLTLRAVILVGGISICLSGLQLVVAIGQLVLAAR